MVIADAPRQFTDHELKFICVSHLDIIVFKLVAMITQVCVQPNTKAF